METPEPSRKTRAIVFSDIQGYSKLMGENESLALRLLEEHNAICVPLIKQNGGAILKFIGDAILSSFESASDAVNCGIAIQKALALRNTGRPTRQQIVVRIGIHIGDVVFKDADVFGDGVNIAARIEPLAEPGGIAISQTVYDMIKARPEIQTISLGAKDLKNIKDAVNIYKVLIEAQTPESLRNSNWRGTRRRLLAALGVGAILAAGAVAIRSLKKVPHSEDASNLLENPGFEQGLDHWKIDGNAAVVNNTAFAHSGVSYAECHSEPGQQAFLNSVDSSGNFRFFPVDPGDVVTWSDWAYRISGDGSANCNLVAADANRGNPSYAASFPNPTPLAPWTHQNGSYSVLPGKSFIRFNCGIWKPTVPASVRFDDVFLHITPASQASGTPAPVSPSAGGMDFRAVAGAHNVADDEAARRKRDEAMGPDWQKLSQLLSASQFPESDKRRWSEQFVRAYKGVMQASMAYRLVDHLPAGAERTAVDEIIHVGKAAKLTDRSLELPADGKTAVRREIKDRAGKDWGVPPGSNATSMGAWDEDASGKLIRDGQGRIVFVYRTKLGASRRVPVSVDVYLKEGSEASAAWDKAAKAIAADVRSADAN